MRSGNLTRKELLLNSFKLGRLEKDLFGATPPSTFVGRFGYPEVLAGPLVSPIVGEPALAEPALADTPDKWLHFSREQIIGLRSNLVRSNFKLNVQMRKILIDCSWRRRSLQWQRFRSM